MRGAPPPVRAALLTDEQVLTLQLVENDQREDVKPSERAAAYGALAAAGKRAEDIAAATGLPVSAVRDLCRLGRLPRWFLDLVDAGEVAYTTAALVARIPGEEDQRRAAAAVALGQVNAGNLDEEDLALCEAGKAREDARYGPADPVLSFRDAKDLLKDFQRELKGAPFRKALDLLDGVPTCDDCPKRAGNAALTDEAYKEVRADTCLDPTCFAAKTEAWGRKLVAKAEKKGRTVIPAEQGAKLFYDHGQLRYGTGYIRPTDTCWEDSKGKEARTYAELLKEHLEPVVAIGPDGKAHDLFDGEAARKALKEHHGIGVAARTGDADQKRRDAEQRRKQEAGRLAGHKAMALVVETMAAASRDCRGGAMMREVALLRQVARTVADNAGADACRMIDKRRGLDFDAVNVRGAVEDLALELDDPAELLGLIAEACAARLAHYWGHPYGGSSVSKEEAAFWSAFGVDKAALVKEATAELKEKAAAKGKGAKPKAAPAAARVTRGKLADGSDITVVAHPTHPIHDDLAPPAGVPLADLDELPAAAADLLEAAGCLTLDQAWAAARQAADAELLKRPPQDVLAGFLAEIGADGHLVHAAASALARELQRQEGKIVAPVRACRVCGCTELDCRGCIEKTGSPCSWVEAGLCSACVPAPAADQRLDMKGEPIAALGLTPAQLSGACERGLKGDGSPPERIKHVTVNGRPHVVLGEAEGFDRGGPTGSRSWEVRPLWTPQQAVDRGVAALAPHDPSCGARVLINVGHGKSPAWNEHVVGAKGEQRRLIHAPAPKPAKRKGVKS